MCGIGLHASLRKQLQVEGLKDYMNCILHRGPDAQHILQLENNLLLASNRLAIIDKDERSDQPMTYNEFTISFNGAIYNYKELRTELEEKGHRFNTQSDTEVILHMYAEYGTECLHKLNGMWAFIIYDFKKKELFGARDRFSIKPFYYYHDSKDFYVASEIKQFKMIDEIKLSYNQKKIVEFIQSGGFKNNDYKTFYNEIFQLEGGTYMLFDLKEFKKELYRYYEFSDDGKVGLKYEEELKSLVHDSVQLRKRADVKSGMTLSGGVDSSVIGMEAFRGEEFNSYSYIELKDKGLNEERYIRAFLDKYPHTNHQVIIPEQIEGLIRECIYYQDEPPASLSVVAQFLVYRLARDKGERVVLSGQGADEIFGGYPRFFKFIPKISILFNLRKTLQLISYLKKKRIDPGMPIFNYRIDSVPNINSSEKYSKYLINKNGLRDLLHYEDRNSMANSIESRLPFLDYRLVERLLKTENRIKFSSGRLKGFLYNAYKNLLPEMIFKRINKLAFDTPEKRLLGQGVFSVEEELNKLKNTFPKMPWKDKIDPKKINVFTAWQIYFLNVFIESDKIYFE